jgi:hypothetical protein
MTQHESCDPHHGHCGFQHAGNREDRGGLPHVTATTVTTVSAILQIVENVKKDDTAEEGWEYIRDEGYLLTFLSPYFPFSVLSFLRSQFLIASTVHRYLYLNCTCYYTLAVLEAPPCYIL